MKDIALLIEDEPSAAQLARGRVPRGGTLLGLYEGRPLTARSVGRPSQYVLEIGGGLSAQHGFHAGQTVEVRGADAAH